MPFMESFETIGNFATYRLNGTNGGSMRYIMYSDVLHSQFAFVDLELI